MYFPPRLSRIVTNLYTVQFLYFMTASHTKFLVPLCPWRLPILACSMCVSASCQFSESSVNLARSHVALGVETHFQKMGLQSLQKDLLCSRSCLPRQGFCALDIPHMEKSLCYWGMAKLRWWLTLWITRKFNSSDLNTATCIPVLGMRAASLTCPNSAVIWKDAL